MTCSYICVKASFALSLPLTSQRMCKPLSSFFLVKNHNHELFSEGLQEMRLEIGAEYIFEKKKYATTLLKNMNIHVVTLK